MGKTKTIEARLEEIERRNERVEADKAWETSIFRKILLIIFTYLVIGLYMSAIDVDDPWLNAIVPAAGFLFSTLTLPILKDWWIKHIYTH